MKRANEVLVGSVVLGAILLVVAGSVWLSRSSFGRKDVVHTARFRSIGGLQKGNPVLLRGVRIGRVDDISLGDSNWVNIQFLVQRSTQLPARPVAIIRSTTLFGDWAVDISSRDALPDDPEVRRQLDDAERAGADKWPGATLPDVGQLTAQAGRIASDIALISSRVQDAFDSTSAARLRGAFIDLSRLSRQLAEITRTQQATLNRIGSNLDTGTQALSRSAQALQRATLRADSATSREQLQRIMNRTDSITGDIAGVASNLRNLSGAAARQQSAFDSIVSHTDSILARLERGEGTLGRLTRDTTLYHESVSAVRSLRSMLDDMQRNPRKYFSFSVF
ncbi:MAG: MlaD family protein [Gemmatimonadales bacterium]|nr:MlaD family protein [Gemmatimonadales bacterium]